MAAARQPRLRLRKKSSTVNKQDDGSSSDDNVHASERHSLSDGDDDHGDTTTESKYITLKHVWRAAKSRSGKFIRTAQPQHGSKDRSAWSGFAGPMPIDNDAPENDAYRPIDPDWLSLKKRDFEARELCHTPEFTTSLALAIRSKTPKTPKLHHGDTPNSPRYAQSPLAQVTSRSSVFGARASRERLHTRKSKGQVNVPLPRAESGQRLHALG